MMCYGLVHIIVAYLAVRVAFGDSGEQADQKGALQEIGGSSFGAVVLWVLTIGLVAYGLWQFMMAAVGYGWVTKKGKRTRRRIASVARGIIGVSLGIYAGRLASGSGGGESGNEGQQEWTAKLMSLPAGRVLVGIVALVVIGVAIAEIRRGIKKSFEQDLDMQDLPTGSQKWVRRLGMIGYIAKGVVLGIVGILLGVAAFQSQPEEAGGLDRALKALAAQPFGTVALVIVAIGLAAFGVYCFAAARAHKS